MAVAGVCAIGVDARCGLCRVICFTATPTASFRSFDELQDRSGPVLVITRREGEEVVIGDPKNPIGVVRIASIRGERVRVAFDFPREVEIFRREVADGISEDDSVVGRITPKTAANA